MLGIQSTLQLPCSQYDKLFRILVSFYGKKFCQIRFGFIVTYKLSYIETRKKGHFYWMTKQTNKLHKYLLNFKTLIKQNRKINTLTSFRIYVQLNEFSEINPVEQFLCHLNCSNLTQDTFSPASRCSLHLKRQTCWCRCLTIRNLCYLERAHHQ